MTNTITTVNHVMKDSEEYHSSLVYTSFPDLLFNIKSGSYFLLCSGNAVLGLMLRSAQDNSKGLDIKAHLEFKPYSWLIPLKFSGIYDKTWMNNRCHSADWIYSY